MLIERFRPFNAKLDSFDVFTEKHKRSNIDIALLTLTIVLFGIIVIVIFTMCSRNSYTKQWF